jgi:N-glycosidase YbiA
LVRRLTKMIIDRFSGQNRFLSNFYPSVVNFEGLRYPTVEHAFQSAKSPDQAVRLRIASLPSAGAAKRAGRQVVIPDVAAWDAKKDSVMLDLLLEKFSIPELCSKLLATGSQELREGNEWGDTYWGVDLATGEGENKLGKLLMEVRSMLVSRDAMQWLSDQAQGFEMHTRIVHLEEQVAALNEVISKLTGRK